MTSASLPPLEPGEIDFEDAGGPRSARFQDRYASPAGALTQARQVFLAGNELPARWQGRERFVLLETGFGLGNNFLAAWDAWRRDPQRSARLFFLSLERYPLDRESLRRAHQGSELEPLAERLIAAWPPISPGLHRLDFDGGALTLLLALGDIHATLPQFQAQVDAFLLDGFAPDRNPEMWEPRILQTLGRLAAPGATAATWCVARATRDALSQAGFSVQRLPGLAGKAQRLAARFEPRHQAPRPAAQQALAPLARRALVLGAGLAGAACARALRQEGLQVTVIDGAAQPAAGASGNPAGLFHGSVHADDGPHARWNRATALRCAQGLADLDWHADGLLRLAGGEDPQRMRDLLQRQALPPDFLQALDAEQTAAISGLPLRLPAWQYSAGGALAPPERVRRDLEGCELRLGLEAASLRAREDGGWQVLDSHDAVLDEAELLVLACGHRLPALLEPIDPDLARLLLQQRGQLAWLSAEQAAQAARPRLPVAGGGYVLPLPDGGLLCGATSTFDDAEPALRAADHEHNLGVWRRLCGAPTAAEIPLQGRVAWRLLAPDRMPLIGGLPREAPAHRATQAAHWPRRPGLLLCGAFASRGITWARLAGELAAALALGLPAPVEQKLIAAVDPARFRVRALRKEA